MGPSGVKKVSVTRANNGGGGGAHLDLLEHFWRHLVDFGSQFWRPLDLGGSIRSAFLDVFGATAKNRFFLVTTIPLKWEEPNT